EDDHPWIEQNPRATVVVMVLRRIAYTLLSLWRSVTLPGHATPVTAPDGRGVMRPWRQETGLAPRHRSGRLAPEPDAAGRPDENRSGLE
ncbi:MAG: hypothetical protein L6Q84_32000, partial [Polyangiaceae bacterium]|nr:hypothetical protein [Polyangiaceae bacterium]